MERVLALSLGVGVAAAVLGAASAEPRLVISSQTVHGTTASNFQAGSGKEIVMRYDLDADPSMKNGVNRWNGGKDIYGKTAYDYTRWDGPLGM